MEAWDALPLAFFAVETLFACIGMYTWWLLQMR